MVNELSVLRTVFLIKLITLSFICIPLSIILSFSFVFFHLDPKSGGTEKGMTVPKNYITISKLFQDASINEVC